MRVKCRIVRNPEDLRVLSKDELINLLCREPVEFDEVDLASLRRHVYDRLETLYKRVCEGKFVDEASEFARWLVWSGLVSLVPEARKLISDVQFECEQVWKRNPRGPWVSKSELESINQKLDLLAGRIAQMPVAEPAKLDLRVLPDSESKTLG